MGWNISHGTDSNGEVRRSYTTMTNLGQQLAHVLSARDWRTIAPLFARREEARFTVSHRDAGRMARVFRTAARNRLLPTDWSLTAIELADSAESAAKARQPWEWR